MITGPTGFYTVAQGMLTAAYDALSTSLGGPPLRYCVVPGAIAWDCCDVGLLAVGSTRQYISDNFPAEHVTPIGPAGGCEAAYVISEFVVEIVRCAPEPADTETAVDCAALSNGAAVLLSDAWVVLNSVTCRLQEWLNVDEIAAYLPRGQAFTGPAGGCVGSAFRVAVALGR